ncbi:MAG: F0F1 ATP synthase subunit B [Muribaculaceae bacterium]|nr:F0F1 ATP synthase subunit B [Muribaculaceae bacterium]
MDLFSPDSGLVIWMFVSFGILFIILAVFAWPAIMKGIAERANFIDKGVEFAQEAKTQLDGAREEAKGIIDEARRQQADILRDADKMKTKIVDEARDAAQAEASKVMAQAKESIAQAQKEAEKNLRNEVSAFALEIAQKVVKTQLDDEKSQKKLVETLMSDMEK